MSHGIFTEMSDLENEEAVASESTLQNLDTDESSSEGHPSANVTDPTDFTMCLREPKIVLDKNDVTQYFKTKRVPSILQHTNRSRGPDESNTSCYNETELKEEIHFLVNSKKCADHVRNTLSIHNASCNRSLLIKNQDAVLEGPIFSQNNNLFRNINDYVAQQSLEMDSSHNYRDTAISDSEVQSCNENEFEHNHNSENIVSVNDESVELECGDDILFTNADGYYNDNTVTTKAESVEMECGDDILFTNDADYHNEDPVATQSESAESVELECGDDILFTDGAGYYNSDEDSTEGNQDFNYSYEDARDQIKEEIEFKNENSFEEEEEELYHCKSEFSSENVFVICEKCGIAFESLPLLKKHQFETCGLKYFYTCKFCPSTSWYSSTLRNHIQVVHSRELDKENIDDIMENIKLSKQVEREQSNDSSNKNIEKIEPVPHKQTSKKTKAKRKKKTTKYIYYREIKEFLRISCFECHLCPEYQKGRTEQHCKRCRNEFTYQCLNCGKFYFKYETAKLHAKKDCKRDKTSKINTTSNPIKKVQEKSTNTVPNKTVSSTSKYVNHICAACHEPMERKGCKFEKICRKCNRTLLKYQCDVCKQTFQVRSMAYRHAPACHRSWRDFLINSSLSTFALLDHNYYCKSISEPEVDKLDKQVQQPQFIEITLSPNQSTRRVYTGKKSRSVQS